VLGSNHQHEADFKEWSVLLRKTKSRHVIQHDGSLLRLVDQLYRFFLISSHCCLCTFHDRSISNSVTILSSPFLLHRIERAFVFNW
jgi:hypothetical protein